MLTALVNWINVVMKCWFELASLIPGMMLSPVLLGNWPSYQWPLLTDRFAGREAIKDGAVVAGVRGSGAKTSPAVAVYPVRDPSVICLSWVWSGCVGLANYQSRLWSAPVTAAHAIPFVPSHWRSDHRDEWHGGAQRDPVHSDHSQSGCMIL